MRYRFYVHKHVASWRMVIADGAPPPAGCVVDDWTPTRTREADDTSPDVRREVGEKGFSLFKLAGEFTDIASDVAALTAEKKRGATAKSLEEHPVHLGLGATVLTEPVFTGSPDWYEAYGTRHAADGTEARLVSMFKFTRPWDTWERHPRGSELVLCTAGAMTLTQEIDGQHVRTTLQPGQYAINAPGVWHTADVTGSATSVFITAGLGTQHRPR